IWGSPWNLSGPPFLEPSMWTPETRAEHDRDELRYPSDLTDAEWQLLAPLLPPPAETGRRRSWPMRELMNALFFVLRGGCPGCMLPEHFPPHQTAYRWFTRFRDDGTWENLNHHLVMLDRERVGREASPSAAIIDSQSVKTTEAGGPRGYDAGKKINGRKREAMVDTDGRGLILQVHAASVQDRDGAIPLLQASRPLYPFIERVSPIAPMAPNGWRPQPGSSSRSCASRPAKSALPCIPGAGWWNASLPGLGAAAASPRTSKEHSSRQQPSSMPLPSCCSHDDLLVRFEIRVGLSAISRDVFAPHLSSRPARVLPL